MRVLVTGGAGFIGSNLVDELVALGHHVSVIDDLSVGRVENVHPRARLLRMDILDPGLADAVAECEPEAVVHLAAQADVQASLADPERDRAVNVDGTRAVALAAVASGARRMVSASSAAVYGDPVELPLAETARKAPANPYGHSKLAAESVLSEALAGTACDHASFRFANVYGPRQDGHGEGGVVAIFATRLADGSAPVIFGDGRQTRDFIYVGDIVAAIIAALEARRALAGELPDGSAYNISTGIETTVNRIAELLSAASGTVGAPEYRDAREGEIARSALDPGKAVAVLGWRAARPLEEGLALTLRHFRGPV